MVKQIEETAMQPINTTNQVAELIHKSTVGVESKVSNEGKRQRYEKAKETQGDGSERAPNSNPIKKSANDRKREANMAGKAASENMGVKDQIVRNKAQDLPKTEGGLDDSDVSLDNETPAKPADHEPDNQGSKDPENDSGKDGNEGEGDQVKEKITLSDIAKELGVEDADLYQIEIPIGKDKSISLGDLKDTFNKWAVKAKQLDNIEARESDLHGEMLRSAKTITDIVSTLPPNVLTPQYFEKIEEYQKVHGQQEMEKLLAIKPEWADPIVATTAKKNMLAAAKNYGLTEIDVSNITDHRWLLALSDLGKLRSDFQGASSEAKKVINTARSVPKQNPKAAKSALGQKLAARAKAGDRYAQSQLVAELLFTKR
jgi:hypothetical protein